MLYVFTNREELQWLDNERFGCFIALNNIEASNTLVDIMRERLYASMDEYEPLGNEKFYQGDGSGGKVSFLWGEKNSLGECTNRDTYRFKAIKNDCFDFNTGDTRITII